MKSKRQYLVPFEARSVMLFAAMALGGAAGAQAQAPATYGARPTTQSSPAAGASAAPAVSPVAASSDKDVAAAFAKADSNRDGKLSREEAEALPAVAQRFEQVDANHDQFISRAEFDKAMKQ